MAGSSTTSRVTGGRVNRENTGVNWCKNVEKERDAELKLTENAKKSA